MSTVQGPVRTRIIATLGPASDSPDMVQRLLAAGVNLFRLNFSHGDREDHGLRMERIRKAAADWDRPVGVLQDLQGPKIRIGRLGEEIRLEEGDRFVFDCALDEPGDSQRVGVTYHGLCRDVQRGETLLLDDGRLAVEVQAIQGRQIVTRVTRGGRLSSSKGINLPGTNLRVPALSEKDVDDVRFGAEIGVDWVAVSFVRNRDDVFLARHYLDRFGSTAKLMAKIEKPTAVERFDQILEAADGVMIARGDLGVELSPEQVPIAQKRLVRAAREAGKPVVTATQMLESMTTSPVPTRAEASDVANAIFDGTDAVMLSGETAIGAYPEEAVRFMHRLARRVEGDPGYRLAMRNQVVRAEQTTPDAVAQAACRMALDIDARVIVSFSASGATALRVARHRVPVAVLALTPNETAYRQLALSWGVDAVLAQREITTTDEMVADANAAILRTGLAAPGDTFVITAGVPFGVTGTTNLIRVETVPET